MSRSNRGPGRGEGPKGAGGVTIVGVGASAGGLEALGQFFRNTPANGGLAFIVVQHMDPTHEDLLPEILQRSTPLKVLQVRDGVRVQPDRVYVIPPNRDLSILHGVLHLLEPVAARGLRLPIDFFLRSLAADRGDRSIGVILSGMGSDGTLGLRAIKEQAGVVFVQSPESAAFDGMPRSAINADLADFVGSPDELPGLIRSWLARPDLRAGEPELSDKSHGALAKICVLLRSQTGHDFSLYKRSTVYRRIERRMGLHHIDSIATYLRFLQANPQEAQLLFKELLIGVTSFFRDPPAWEILRKKAVPDLLAERSKGGALRAWVAGCSTGEEAYSLAIVFHEAMRDARPGRRWSLQIFATDLDKDSIDRARRGQYSPNIAADVSPERLQKFFVQDEHGYRVAPSIRETVIFAPQNAIMDPPFTKLDILTCRNLLIYLSPELQRKLLPLFHYALNPGGILFLGSAETTGPAAGRFRPINAKARLYRKEGPATEIDQVDFPSSFHTRDPARVAPPSAKATAGLQAPADLFLLERYAPAAVLTNDQGDILYVRGHTGKYLEPAAGKANWNLHAMAREGLRYPLGTAFQRAVRERSTVKQAGVRLEGEPGLVDVTIEPLQEPSPLRGKMMVIFTDAAAALPSERRPRARKGRARAPAAVERQLDETRAELRSTQEEMQSSQEELKSANEELQSTNEELQSTNEELTTSKEEMQSLNEELQTLNQELHGKVEDLSRVNDDMRNLLDSTDIATLFLDDDLKVRRFTPQMTKIIKLIPGDVNRPITDLASNLVYPELAADALNVLRTLIARETQVKTFDDRWFSVRIMPYRTMEKKVSGVVLTFVDISASKTLEAVLRGKSQEVKR